MNANVLLLLTHALVVSSLPTATEQAVRSEQAPSYVDAHNAKRVLHCDTPSLVWSAQLEAEAQAYADTCPTGHASFSDRDSAGENLYYKGYMGAYFSPSVSDSYTEAVQSWYDEISSYDFATGASKDGGVIGHFTQVVWKETTEVGCGVKLDCSNMFGGGWTNSAVVCRYKPAGNWVGEFTKNVGPLASSGACFAAVGGAPSSPVPASGSGGGDTDAPPMGEHCGSCTPFGSKWICEDCHADVLPGQAKARMTSMTAPGVAQRVAKKSSSFRSLIA
jgi:uncharacterized protein YkwD